MIAEKTAPSAAANLFGDAKIGFGVTFRVLSISFDNKPKGANANPNALSPKSKHKNSQIKEALKSRATTAVAMTNIAVNLTRFSSV